jgi:hypothetical protein
MKRLTKDEARRIAVNIAKLLELLGASKASGLVATTAAIYRACAVLPISGDMQGGAGRGWGPVGESQPSPHHDQSC